MESTNNYLQAVEVGLGLFAVKLQSGFWSVADGPGSILCEPDEKELSGWHLSVRFDSEAQATNAIRSGPHVMFDIAPDSAWTTHCLARGARQAKEDLPEEPCRM